MTIRAALSRANSFAALYQIAAHATSDLSFWGCKEVRVRGFNDKLSINDLPKRLMQILKERGYEFTENERRDGSNVVTRITRIDREYDAQFSQSCFLTKVFVAIRAIFSMIFFKDDTAARWLGAPGQGIEGEWNAFNLFTRNQYLERFGFAPEQAVSRGYSPPYEALLWAPDSTRPRRWWPPTRPFGSGTAPVY